MRRLWYPAVRNILFIIWLRLSSKEGDEVIIPPYWVSYPDIVILTGAKPVILKTNASDGFKIGPGQLEKAINPRTKAVIINSPSNPTGAAYTQAELAELAEVVVKKDVLAYRTRHLRKNSL